MSKTQPVTQRYALDDYGTGYDYWSCNGCSLESADRNVFDLPEAHDDDCTERGH